MSGLLSLLLSCLTAVSCQEGGGDAVGGSKAGKGEEVTVMIQLEQSERNRKLEEVADSIKELKKEIEKITQLNETKQTKETDQGVKSVTPDLVLMGENGKPTDLLMVAMSIMESNEKLANKQNVKGEDKHNKVVIAENIDGKEKIDDLYENDKNPPIAVKKKEVNLYEESDKVNQQRRRKENKYLKQRVDILRKRMKSSDEILESEKKVVPPRRTFQRKVTTTLNKTSDSIKMKNTRPRIRVNPFSRKKVDKSATNNSDRAITSPVEPFSLEENLQDKSLRPRSIRPARSCVFFCSRNKEKLPQRYRRKKRIKVNDIRQKSELGRSFRRNFPTRTTKSKEVINSGQETIQSSESKRNVESKQLSTNKMYNVTVAPEATEKGGRTETQELSGNYSNIAIVKRNNPDKILEVDIVLDTID